jgi:glycosyltransferase involved in cell wall biosynthesis
MDLQNRPMASLISIIIPNRNGESTIGLCLEAVYRSAYEPFEVIVVDDHSEDRSVAEIERFPCRLVQLDRHSGASAARNAGAAESRGEILFFTDADCLLQADSLAIAADAFSRYGPDVIVGGTYTPDPYDADFFSRFQSLFVNYSETKHTDKADYAAGHAMVIAAATFRRCGGFSEGFLPVAEDVEFSHRLRRAGHRIVIEPRLRVRHIFGFSLYRSLRNAAFKSMYWTAYSIRNKDVFADSGTASTELKANLVFCLATLTLLLVSVANGNVMLLYLTALPVAANLMVGRGLIMALFKGGGAVFGVAATAYYLFVFPLAVGAGVLAGVARHLTPSRYLRKGE